MTPPAARLPVATARLVLRAPAFDDATRLARLANDETIARNLRDMPFPFGQREASAFIGDVLASNMAGGGLACMIAPRERPEAMIGLIAYGRRDDIAELGYWIGRNARRKGFAREACLAMLGLVLQDAAVERIEAGVFADNVASQRLLESLGFVLVRQDMAPSLARPAPAVHGWLTLSRADAEGVLAKAAKRG